MSRYAPFAPASRFLQVELAGIEGEGYRFVSLGLSDGSGNLACRGGINTSRPGVYTLDAHAINPGFRDGALSRAFLTVGVAGSSQTPAGEVTPGPRFHLRWIRLSKAPLDGLAVTLVGGTPLPEVLRRGDRVHLEVQLQQPAADVTVQPLGSHTYTPVAINGAASIQLARADDEGRVWMADVTLGDGTDRFVCEGYPLVFRAVIAGGAVAETYASAFSSIEP